MITIERVFSRKRKEDAQRVRYEVYVDQDKKFQDCDFPGKLMKIPHDDEPGTIILTAYHEGKSVGTISGYVYSDVLGLPIDETIETVKDEFCLEKFIKNRKFDSLLYSCGMLAIDEHYRGATNIKIWLFRFILEQARRQGCQDIIVTVNYKLEKTLLAIGFEHLVSHSWYSEEIGNDIFLMYGRTCDIAKVLELQAVPGWCDNEFGGSTKIGIWHDEDIVERGSKGDEFYLILEGSAMVIAKTENRRQLLATLNQGQTFGEMALFSGERTATVHSNYCVAKILSQQEIMSIIEDPERSKPLIKVIVKRLIEMNNKVENNFSSFKLFSSILSEDIIKNLPVQTLAPATTICRLGDKGTTAYRLKEGQVDVVLPGEEGRDVVVARVIPPSLVGHMALFNDECRTANMVTLGETELYVIEEDNFWEIFKDIESRKKLVKTLLELIGEMNRMISQNPNQEEFVVNFKNWVLNYFKTKKLQEAIGLDGDFSDNIPNLTVPMIQEGLGVKDEIENFVNQLLEKGIVSIEEGRVNLIKEKEFENFKFDF